MAHALLVRAGGGGNKRPPSTNLSLPQQNHALGGRAAPLASAALRGHFLIRVHPPSPSPLPLPSPLAGVAHTDGTAEAATGQRPRRSLQVAGTWWMAAPKPPGGAPSSDLPPERPQELYPNLRQHMSVSSPVSAGVAAGVTGGVPVAFRDGLDADIEAGSRWRLWQLWRQQRPCPRQCRRRRARLRRQWRAHRQTHCPFPWWAFVIAKP